MEWATAAKKKEDDHVALEKYILADEVKIKELTVKIENLTKLAIEQKSNMENEVTETQSRKLELNRTAKLFKIQHQERGHLVQQWNETVQVMKNRYQEIGWILTEYVDANHIYDDEFNTLSKRRKLMVELEYTLTPCYTGRKGETCSTNRNG